jgi:hypothetical protein
VASAADLRSVPPNPTVMSLRIRMPEAGRYQPSHQDRDRASTFPVSASCSSETYAIASADSCLSLSVFTRSLSAFPSLAPWPEATTCCGSLPPSKRLTCVKAPGNNGRSHSSANRWLAMSHLLDSFFSSAVDSFTEARESRESARFPGKRRRAMQKGANLFVGRLGKVLVPLSDSSEVLRRTRADDLVGNVSELVAGLR